jgi:hypothetical protein
MEQQPHIDVAVDITEAAMSEAAKLVGVDQRCAELRLKVLRYARDVMINSARCFHPGFTSAKAQSTQQNTWQILIGKLVNGITLGVFSAEPRGGSENIFS